ncbi:ALBINO3-like protein 2 [Morus notabilis]|uniref:ALBINO3-like protein 2 n=1 Tax=Morus notabilis TaxID=981085 RepID=W9SEX0_9ROSA|nr:ALBINO3-like protein 2 [Morus notabilis]
MATHKILRRLRPSIPTTYLSTLSHSRQYHLLTNPNPNSTTLLNPLHPFSHLDRLTLPSRTANSLAGALGPFYSRSIFTRADDDSEFTEAGGFDVDSITKLTELVPESKLVDAGLSSAGEESILPVRALISLLDGFHEFTGLPWWLVIVSSTVALRATLFPLLIFQLHKLKRIGELFHKLPSPIPLPLSGKSYIDQIQLFQKERKAVGCPSFLWFFPYVCVQVPCFILWMTTIRSMSLDHHPGFDSGGTLWFQNLTEYSHGAPGVIFPVVIAALHYTNAQIAFRTSSVKKATGLLDVLVKGSLVYWATNGSLTCIQQLSLKHPVVREKLGLPDKDNSSSAAVSVGTSSPAIIASSKPEKQLKKSVEELSPLELISLSVQLLGKGDAERASHMIKLILAKDPESEHGLILMGQALLQKGLLAEAIKYLERAISKLLVDGFPTEVETLGHLIIASQWAGAAYSQQGKIEEGLVHLERVGKLKEPDDPKVKGHYFDTLLLLSSALYNVGRREEASEYLRLLVAHNPAYSKYLEQCENDDDSFVSDLANSRRRDY